MNRTRLMTPLLLLATVAPAFAMDSFDFTIADIRVMEDRKVQNDMGVTQAQRDRMNAFAKQHAVRVGDYQKQIQGLQPTEANKKKVQLQLVGFLKRLKTEVFGVLTPAQLKRLREITLQRGGWLTLGDERVAKRAGLSAADTKKVQAIIEASAKQVQTMERNAAEPVLAPYKGRKPKDQAQAQQWQSEVESQLRQTGERIKPQLLAVQAKAVSSIQKTLTAKQRSAFIALQGRKYVPK